jgi:hypothetical protein|tara:strand:+ start:566 stop:721 length:156 start_codon:yes stop_codon:yes gene_type:complete
MAVERLRIGAGVRFEWLLFADAWFCGLSNPTTTSSDSDDDLESSALGYESE